MVGLEKNGRRSINPKGFTLYEIAVVLVVIGIILGLLFQTTALTNVAKLKKDCSAIEKVRSALVIYSQVYKRLPGDVDGSNTILLRYSDNATKELINAGLMTREDFNYRIIKNGVRDNHTYRFTRCVTNDGAFDISDNSSAGDYDIHSFAIFDNISSSPLKSGKPNVPLGGVCVSLHTGSRDSDNKTIANFDKAMPKNLFSAYELYFDDADVNLGIGRRATIGNISYFKENTGDNDTLTARTKYLHDSLRKREFLDGADFQDEAAKHIYMIKVW